MKEKQKGRERWIKGRKNRKKKSREKERKENRGNGRNRNGTERKREEKILGEIRIEERRKE